MRERRRNPDRRGGGPGRRSSDYIGGVTAVTTVAAVCGGLVVLYLFFVAIGAVDPSEDPKWAVAALLLALVWLAYSWRRLGAGGASPRADRERRGF